MASKVAAFYLSLVASEVAYSVFKFKLVPIVVKTSHLNIVFCSDFCQIAHLLITGPSSLAMVHSNLVAVSCTRGACKKKNMKSGGLQEKNMKLGGLQEKT